MIVMAAERVQASEVISDARTLRFAPVLPLLMRLGCRAPTISSASNVRLSGQVSPILFITTRTASSTK